MQLFQLLKLKYSLNIYYPVYRYLILFCFLLAVPLSADESISIFKLGERFFNDSLYNLALEQYQKFLNVKNRSHENDPVASYKIAFCHYKMGNNLEAAKSFEEYIRLYPTETNIIEAMYNAGVARRKTGDLKEASDWFFSIWSRFSGSARARMALFEAARCAENDKNTERAIELYNLYFDRFPQTENAKQTSLSLIELYIDQKEYARADEILSRIEKEWKNDKEFGVRVLYFKALLAMKIQKMELAEKNFKEMFQYNISDFPEIVPAYTAYINVLIAKRKFTEAHDVFKKLADIYSDKSIRPQSSFIIAWADNARKARLFLEAAKLFQKCLDEYSGEINIYKINYRLAECYVGMEDFPKAIETLRSIEMKDTSGEYSVRSVLKIGELYYNKGLYPSAIAAYRRYLELPNQKNKDRIMYRIGKIYMEKYKRYNAALREFDNLLKWYPSSPLCTRVLFETAMCQEELKDFQSALRNYDNIYESGTNDTLTKKSQRRAEYIENFIIKESDMAVKELAELVQMDPSKVTKLERLYKTANIFEKYLKNYIKALEIYEEIEKIKPSLPDSMYAYIKLKKAYIYHKLFEKADFESDSGMAAYSRGEALKYYNDIIDNYGESPYADEAAYSIMMMTSPNINEYEAFINKYPTSRYLDEILINIAKHYEKRSATVNIKFSRKAIQSYSEIVNRFPSSKYVSMALIGLTRNYLVLGELDSTSKIAEIFAERFPNSVHDAEIYYINGILAKKCKNYHDAVGIFKQVLYRYPFSAFAERSRYELAFAELKTGNVFEALNNYRLYLQNYPDGLYVLESRYGIAKCLFKLYKRDEAVEIFEELLAEKLPEDILADIHYELACVTEDEGKIYEALNHYKTVLSVKSYPDKMKVLRQMGDIYFNNRIYKDAAESFNKALAYAQIESDSVDVMTRLITAMIMNGDSKKADRRIKYFKDRFEDKYRNNLAEIIYYEGSYFLAEKKYDKAINRFKYIRQKYEDSDRLDDASYQIALCMYYQNKLDDALELFRKFPVLYPSSEFIPLSYFKIAMIFHSQNDFMQAAQYFSMVVSHEKVDSNTRFRAANNAAVDYQKTSSWLDAANMYNIIINDYPDLIHKSSFHLKCGFCLLQASHIEDAFQHFKKANIDPQKEDEPEIVYWIGTCHAKLGNYLKAIAEYLKVPYLYADVGKWGITSEFEAARLYERLGEYSKAVTLYRKIVRSDGEQGRFGRKALLRIQRLNSLESEN